MAMATQYYVGNFAAPTTAAPVAVATGTATKTLLQITCPSTRGLNVVEWGISFTGTPASVVCELIHTTTVAGGTATAVTPTVWSDALSPASMMTAGFSPTTEGSVVATTRIGDVQIVSSNQYIKQFPLGSEFDVPPSGVLRVRVTAAVSVNALCYVIWHEG